MREDVSSVEAGGATDEGEEKECKRVDLVEENKIIKAEIVQKRIIYTRKQLLDLNPGRHGFDSNGVSAQLGAQRMRMKAKEKSHEKYSKEFLYFVQDSIAIRRPKGLPQHIARSDTTIEPVPRLYNPNWDQRRRWQENQRGGRVSEVRERSWRNRNQEESGKSTPAWFDEGDVGGSGGEDFVLGKTLDREADRALFKQHGISLPLHPAEMPQPSKPIVESVAPGRAAASVFPDSNDDSLVDELFGQKAGFDFETSFNAILQERTTTDASPAPGTGKIRWDFQLEPQKGLFGTFSDRSSSKWGFATKDESVEDTQPHVKALFYASDVPSPPSPAPAVSESKDNPSKGFSHFLQQFQQSGGATQEGSTDILSKAPSLEKLEQQLMRSSNFRESRIDHLASSQESALAQNFRAVGPTATNPQGNFSQLEKSRSTNETPEWMQGYQPDMRLSSGMDSVSRGSSGRSLTTEQAKCNQINGDDATAALLKALTAQRETDEARQSTPQVSSSQHGQSIAVNELFAMFENTDLPPLPPMPTTSAGSAPPHSSQSSHPLPSQGRKPGGYPQNYSNSHRVSHFHTPSPPLHPSAPPHHQEHLYRMYHSSSNFTDPPSRVPSNQFVASGPPPHLLLSQQAHPRHYASQTHQNHAATACFHRVENNRYFVQAQVSQAQPSYSEPSPYAQQHPHQQQHFAPQQSFPYQKQQDLLSTSNPLPSNVSGQPSSRGGGLEKWFPGLQQDASSFRPMPSMQHMNKQSPPGLNFSAFTRG